MSWSWAVIFRETGGGKSCGSMGSTLVGMKVRVEELCGEMKPRNFVESDFLSKRKRGEVVRVRPRE